MRKAKMSGLKIILMLAVMLSSLVLSTAIVQAIGIAPSREIINYDTSEQTINVRIINNMHTDETVMIYAEGELQDYVTMSDSKLRISSTENEKSFSYTIKLPDNLEPGTRKLNIIALQLADDEDGKSTMILSRMSVAHQLEVNVPYPGLYAEGIVFITESPDNKATITTNVVNKGSDIIKKVSGDIIIKGPTNKELARIRTGTTENISHDSYGQLINEWQAENPGEYYAEIILNYDGKQLTVKKTFTIGDQGIDISKIDVKGFKLGSVVRFDMDLVNKWNQQINDIYAEIEISDKQGNVLDNVKTINTDMPASTTQTLSTYWDATNVKVGEYTLKATAHYLGKTRERIFNAIIGIDYMLIQDNVFTGKAIAPSGDEGKFSFIYILLIILIVINIVWLVYYKKIRTKKE